MNPFTLAAEYVADTVALVVYLEKRRLGADSQAVFDSTESSNTIIHIPAFVFAEDRLRQEIAPALVALVRAVADDIGGQAAVPALA